MTLTPDQIDNMLREASELEKGCANECVRDVCCHVRALAAEIERLKKGNADLRAVLQRIEIRAAAQPIHLCDVAIFDLRTIAEQSRAALRNLEEVEAVRWRSK